MQAVVKDKLILSVPFLGGVNEDLEVFNLPLEEFKSTVGCFPYFNGSLARCPGKSAIRYETSPIRSIHQSFAVGSFCFYVESDRLLLYNECENARYTVKPIPPTDLGTDTDGRTIDVLGGRSLVPLSPPDLNFSPKCIPNGDAPDPDPDPGGGGGDWGQGLFRQVMTGAATYHESGQPPGGLTILAVQIDYVYEDSTVVTGSITYHQGVDFDTADTGSFFDYTDEVKTKLLNGSSPLFGFRFFEVTSGRKPIDLGSNGFFDDPPGELGVNTYGPPIDPTHLPASQYEHVPPYAADWPEIIFVGYWT